MKNYFSLNSMSKKLLFILMSVALISTATVTAVFSAYELKTAKQEQTQSLKSLSQILAPNISTALIFYDTAAIKELIEPLLMRSDIVSVDVINNFSQQLASVTSPKYSQESSAPHTIEVKTVLTIDAQRYGTLIVRADDSDLNDRAAFYGRFIIVLMIFSFILSLLVSLMLRKRFLNPILYLAQTAEKITSSNDYSLRAKELSKDEVGKLTSCFNTMLQTIEQRDNLLENQVKRRTKELENANVQLHQYAYQDGLTDLPNRRYFYEHLQQLVSTPEQPFSLVFIDLDGFKEVNDSLGHDFGDLLLHEVAKRLRRCLKQQDIVARLGGDEFTLILKGISDTTAVSHIAHDVMKSLTRTITIKNEHVQVTASIGVAFFPHDGISVETLVKRADQAMYLSKSKGRNRFEFFSYEMEELAIEKRRLIEEIRIGLNNNQFELYYQPIWDPHSRTLKKAEALIRWNHPERGIIGPVEFIDIAEQNGLIKELGEWVKSQAVRDAVQFNKLSYTPVQISVNTSPLEIDRDGIWVTQWVEACKLYNLPPHTILIEITENSLMDPDNAIQHHLKRLNALDIDIAIDDFGVGYSSLAYLQQLDIDILKIDQSFIQNIEANSSSIALIKAIITMAHNLGVEVVAEGVETPTQQAQLIALGCDYIQGYLYSKPLSKQDFINSHLQIKATVE